MKTFVLCVVVMVLSMSMVAVAEVRSTESVQAELDQIGEEFKFLENLRYQIGKRMEKLQLENRALLTEKRRAMVAEATAAAIKKEKAVDGEVDGK